MDHPKTIPTATFNLGQRIVEAGAGELVCRVFWSGAVFYAVLLGTCIPLCDVPPFVSNVHLRCGLPLDKWTLISMLDLNAWSIVFVLPPSLFHARFGIVPVYIVNRVIAQAAVCSPR